MSISSRLSHGLRQALGEEAAEDMMSWMDEVDSHGHATADLSSQMTEFRQSMRADFAEFKHEVSASISGLRQEIAQAKYDLIKWSFVFWVSAVLSIAALARVLR